ncbi:cytochrome bd-I ubiquinol oxidase subunit 2 apoprotein [Alteribacillus persepolensis]|uniref:Cytochrome bd-I ubiquinol oxidase subunit 2 apoprotein n=1 Tax=Alteribacillus persepolensis TaxID=568899 RepID=A0A1G8GPS8_9BACI|nr:cytochrome d ubiquinol oxidase subunit II [Alteribacillus persepolensis]SDH96404.1 cytochrome bd-I ubiquinol oxidase subunit 2 apoprotein [Alteribacillus persepolensis]
MEPVYVALLLMWLMLFTYAILGSIDFGTGFWAMYYQRRQNDEAAKIANNYLSPGWKVTNVFFVLLVVSFVGFFPGAAPTLGTLMIVPFCLALLLLTIRSAFLVFAYSTAKYKEMLTLVSGMSGLFIPAILVSILPAAIGGFIEYAAGQQYILLNELFISPTFYTHIGFGLCTELFIAALFLSDYAREGGHMETYRVYRKNAVFLGPITLAFAVAVIFTLIPEAPWMFENFLDVWWIYTISLLAFAIGYSALWWPSSRNGKGQPRASFLLIVLQFGIASIAYGSALMPYFLYPDLTVHDAFTNEAMYQSLLIGYIIGMAILVPVFIGYWRLFLKDKRYLTSAEK